MKIWVYVEGMSDKLALSALWSEWKQNLKRNGWGIQPIPLKDKSNYFKKIGTLAAEKLKESKQDLIVGLPDLYPNKVYEGTKYQHTNLSEIQIVQRQLVKDGLKNIYGVRNPDLYMDRFFASALKHDLEVLLLAAESQLKNRLQTGKSGQWIKPPENQNQNKPPKRIVEQLFLRDRKRAYRETIDGPAILRDANLREMLFDNHGAPKCPAFQEVLDWVGKETGVTAY